ncbi:hypothetical protein JW826_06460 [Candidatus Woesearchaeota archaeon]|nr:hypothetical protein [Candidatus Woesearchaeota archaeon]
MKPDEQIQRLQETRDEVVRFTNEMQERLATGEIQTLEHKIIIEEKLCGKTKEELLSHIDRQMAEQRKSAKRENGIHAMNIAAIMLAAMIIIAGTAGLFGNDADITGFAVKQAEETLATQETITALTERVIELDKVTGLKISGSITGEGARFTLKTAEGELLVGEVTGSGQQAREYTLTTDKKTYSLGEEVQITTTPEEDDNMTVYVHQGEEATLIETGSYAPTSAGEYIVVGIIATGEDIIRLEVRFEVINATNETEKTINLIQEEPQETARHIINSTGLSFTDLCTETCEMNETNRPVLVIEPSDGTQVTITEIKATRPKENQPPRQALEISDVYARPGEEKEVDMSRYFTDPDDSQLHYDVSGLETIASSTLGSKLKIYSAEETEETARVYATDGDTMITSNEFQIIISEEAPEEGNQTLPQNTEPTPAQSNYTQALTDPCSAPNPNERPLECLDNKEYFQDQAIFITTSDREQTARITPIGNLLIRGEVIEGSAFSPRGGDYAINHEDEYGNVKTTIWFDSETGDLHMTGKLYEENANIDPSPGSFTLKNKKGIVLAWADQGRGDLHIRGNVIPYRKDINK